MSHGSIGLIAQRCTSCMICARQCPAWCIHIDSHTERIGDPDDRRPRSVKVLDRFEIDWGVCMYCGICIADCPFDALEWRAGHNPAAEARPGLRQAWTGGGTTDGSGGSL
ncbi:4Fe-4S binding protein [Acidipropionibacterium virtanenii]|uniref:NADH-quinone oxidoreductase subunit I n=1 Tax=Acidipropionibacterium virtanenii TaxID=2057246 RepID=A0A344US45_9ACTN|nr:NADH-quinone oxidoreductase subunit I [Acidipropionibacterium virtanenii]